MAKPIKHPIPAFHDLPMGGEVVDMNGNRYRIVGTRRAEFFGRSQYLVSFRRVSDGETRELAEGAMQVIVEYHPPVRVRTRTREATQ